MHQYHELPNNWNNGGKFTIAPLPKIRQYWPFMNILPYHVGDRVRFHVHFEEPSPLGADYHSSIRESFAGKVIHGFDVNGTDTDITGSIIDKEGDVAYYILQESKLTDLYPIFTTRAESKDTINSRWAWAFVGFFSALFVGFFIWLLNFFQIIPFWKFWIP